MLCPKTKPLLVNNQVSEFKYNLVNADIQTRSFTYDNGPSGIVIIPDPEVTGYATQMQDNLIQKQSVNRNKIIETSELQLKRLYLSSPDLAPEVGSPVLVSANLNGPDFTAFFTAAAHVGAVGTDNWTNFGVWVNWQ